MKSVILIGCEGEQTNYTKQVVIYYREFKYEYSL